MLGPNIRAIRYELVNRWSVMSFETDRAALCFMQFSVTMSRVMMLSRCNTISSDYCDWKNNRGKRRKNFTVKRFSTINTIASADWPRDLIKFDRIPHIKPTMKIAVSIMARILMMGTLHKAIQVSDSN